MISCGRTKHGKEKYSSGKIRLFLMIIFDKQTPHDSKVFRECTKVHLISTLRLTEEIPKRSRDVLFTPELKDCFDCYKSYCLGETDSPVLSDYGTFV